MRWMVLLGSVAASGPARQTPEDRGKRAATGLLPGCWEPVRSRVHLIPDADCWIDGLDDAARRGDVFVVFDPESMTTCLGNLLDG